MQTPGQIVRAAALPLAAVLGVLAACVEFPSGPGSQVPARLRVVIVLPAGTPAEWLPAGDTLRIRIRRAGRAAPIVDVSTATDSLAAHVQVPLEQAVERFVATAELEYGGQLMFLAFEAVQLRADGDTTITLNAEYAGAGGAARTLLVTAADSTLAGGDTTRVSTTALDSLGRQLGMVPVRFRSIRPDLFTVDSAGLVTASGTISDSSRVDVVMPTGLTASLPLWLVASWLPPQGQTVTYVSTRDGNREVYAMMGDGSAVLRLTNSTDAEYFPTWAPDGGTIAFERDVGGARQLFAITLADGAIRQLTTLGANSAPRFSPDGSRIGFTSTRSGGPEAWVMDADGSNPRRLIDPVGNADTFSDWAPDGSRFVFIRRAAPLDVFASAYVADTNGANVAPVTENDGSPLDLTAGRWSPWGGEIVFTERQSSDTVLVAYTLSGAPGFSGNVANPSVSFDAYAAFAGAGDAFVFESESAGIHGVYARDGSGAVTRLSPNAVEEHEPDHRVASAPLFVDTIVITPAQAGLTSDEQRQVFVASARDAAGQTRPVPIDWLDRQDGRTAALAPGDLVAIAPGAGWAVATYGGWRTDSVPITITAGTGANPRPLVFGADHQIYVMDGDGTGVTSLTALAPTNTDATFSPDGSRIAWRSHDDGDGEIWVMNADGTGQQPLTANTVYDAAPTWSPDGNLIAFSSELSGPDDAVWMMDATGAGLRQLTFPASGVEHVDPAWSPDGSVIVFAALSGGNATLHTVSPLGGLEGALGITGRYPAWSPDGATLYYSGGSPSVIRHRPFPSGAETVLTTGCGPLVCVSAGDFEPSVSEDGLIAYWSLRHSAAGGQVMVMRADGTAQSGLVATGGNSPGSFQFSASADWQRSTPPLYAAAVTIGGDAATPIDVGTTRALTASALDQLVAPIVPVGGFVWTSFDPSVASVDSAGVVTGVAPGTAFIELASGIAQPDTVAVTVVTPAPQPIVFAAIDAGLSYACGLSDQQIAYCWGGNTDGQLGDGTTTASSAPVAVATALRFAAITAGDAHSCAITAAGAAYCWGSNVYGQLGDGTMNGSGSPQPVTGALTFATIDAGEQFTCGVTTGGAAYCWGRNLNGRLGDNTTTDRATPALVSGGLTFASISTAIGQHTCGVASGGQAYCWGRNTNGQLGDNSTSDRLVPTAVAGGLTFAMVSASANEHSCGVTTVGQAFCWGLNSFGALGDGSTTTRLAPVGVTGGLTMASVSGGANGFTCGLTTAGAAYCWGLNNVGQIGNGTTTFNFTAPVAVSGGLTFAGLSAGFAHVSAFAADGAGHGWGGNGSGQLGDGTTTLRRTPTAMVPPN